MTDSATTLLPRIKLVWSWYKAIYGIEEAPRAARRVFRILLEKGWREACEGSFRFKFSDSQLAKWLNVGRRTIQKGLRQLEDLGIISRPRIDGSRVIAFLGELAGRAKRAPNASTKKETKPTPTTPPEPAPGAPELDPGPPLSPEEVAAQIRNIIGTEADPATPESSRPTRRIGMPIGAAIPKTPDPEKIRQAEEKRRLANEWLAARKQAREASGQDRSTSPAQPDETARE
jgi:DNA-binding transcriptional ArsR family regulator